MDYENCGAFDVISAIEKVLPEGILSAVRGRFYNLPFYFMKLFSTDVV